MTGQVGPLLTVGHGTLAQEALTRLLHGAQVQQLVDVRRFPGSRLHHHVRREALQEWLPAAGVDYRWEPGLGGRRRLPADQPVEDPWWRVEAFRAYAAHTRTPEFTEAFETLLRGSTDRRVAVLCSEAVWWRCHRRVLADVAVVAHGRPVLHLMPDGALRPHEPSEGARRTPDGHVVWDR